jgi:hypothetical protein
MAAHSADGTGRDLAEREIDSAETSSTARMRSSIWLPSGVMFHSGGVGPLPTSDEPSPHSVTSSDLGRDDFGYHPCEVRPEWWDLPDELTLYRVKVPA